MSHPPSELAGAAMRVACLETGRRPARVALALREGERFVLLVLDPSEAPELRRTALRRPEDGAPPGAEAVAELSLRAGAVPGGLGFVVERLAPRWPLEHRQAGGRRRLVAGDGLPPGVSLELGLEGLGRVELRLLLEDAGQGSARRSLGGSGTHRSQVAAADAGWAWLVPSIWSVLADKRQWLLNNLWALGARLGLNRRTIGLVTAAVLLAILNGGLLWSQARKVDAAREEADGARQARADAEAAAQAALAGELACLDERQELARALASETEARQLAVEAAVGFGSARAVALELGGAPMGAEELLGRDAMARTGLLDHVGALVGTPEAAAGDRPARCLAHADVLGSDLPRYALLWHPSPDHSCPDDYFAILDGRRVAGRWGLSERVLREHGGAPSATAVDLRREDRHAARTLATALRTTQVALLDRGRDRPAVLPGQAQLWSLALFAAYDSLPTLGEASLDGDLPTCVEGLLDGLAALEAAPGPGEPLLPDIVAVAAGEARVPTPATAACPWPPQAVAEGARSALLAVARLTRADTAAQVD